MIIPADKFAAMMGTAHDQTKGQFRTGASASNWGRFGGQGPRNFRPAPYGSPQYNRNMQAQVAKPAAPKPGVAQPVTPHSQSLKPPPLLARPKPAPRLPGEGPHIRDEHGEVDLAASRQASYTAKPGESVMRYVPPPGQRPPASIAAPRPGGQAPQRPQQQGLQAIMNPDIRAIAAQGAGSPPPQQQQPRQPIRDEFGPVDLKASREASYTAKPGEKVMRYMTPDGMPPAAGASTASPTNATTNPPPAGIAAPKPAASTTQPANTPPASIAAPKPGAQPPSMQQRIDSVSNPNLSDITAEALGPPKKRGPAIRDENGEVDLEASRKAAQTAKPGEKVMRYYPAPASFGTPGYRRNMQQPYAGPVK